MTAAKKLKKTWVNTKKIKSKWKAEKRREGLATGSNLVERISEEGELSDDLTGDEADGRNEGADLLPTRTDRKDSSREEGPQAEKERSLRDMTREAYSQSSLHTYKSDPLSRRRRREEGVRGGRGYRGTGAPAGRGRGQPNMKLRMEVMLEKIKRDLP